MKALTLWQPWASLLACGAKQYETRSWATNYRGPIAIHAADRKPIQDFDSLGMNVHRAIVNALKGQFHLWSEMPTGCIIATAELVACYEMYESNELVTDTHICIRGLPVGHDELLFGDWSPGRFAWEFANMTMLPEPIPAKGHQRIWNWEAKEGQNG